MSSPDRYVGLVHLFGGYFHADWMDESENAQDAVERFGYNEAPHLVSLARADLRAVLGSGRSESGLQQLLDAWGCEYYLPVEGLTARDWLRRVEEWLTPPHGDFPPDPEE
jgi:hypothetical protein